MRGEEGVERALVSGDRTVGSREGMEVGSDGSEVEARDDQHGMQGWCPEEEDTLSRWWCMRWT